MTSELELQLQRTVDRLRSMSAAQISRESRDEATRSLVGQLAAFSRPGTTVPVVAPTALGDQLAVIGREFINSTTPDQHEWAIEQLKALRQSL